MSKFIFKDNEVSFKEYSTGLCQASINSVSIPLLFEAQLKDEIVSVLKSLDFKNTSSEMFKNIVSGCIKIHMRKVILCQ